jgi:hypothetical protein
MRPIQPPKPSWVLWLRPRGFPSSSSWISGGSMSRPGMAASAENIPGSGAPCLMSIEDGDPTPMREPRSACVAGVGIAVVASPKSAFMSSSRTFAVSGYTKYTRPQSAPAQDMSSQGHLPRTKLTAQKKACTRYSRHLIVFWRMGVSSPTRKLNAQLLAVLKLAPLARMLRGKISGG